MSNRASAKLKWSMLLFSVIVFMHHCRIGSFFQLQQEKPSFMRIPCAMISAVMYWFFFISTFLLYRNLSRETIISKLKSRIFSLLIPYFLWNTLYFIVFLF